MAFNRQTLDPGHPERQAKSRLLKQHWFNHDQTRGWPNLGKLEPVGLTQLSAIQANEMDLEGDDIPPLSELSRRGRRHNELPTGDVEGLRNRAQTRRKGPDRPPNDEEKESSSSEIRHMGFRRNTGVRRVSGIPVHDGFPLQLLLRMGKPPYQLELSIHSMDLSQSRGALKVVVFLWAIFPLT